MLRFLWIRLLVMVASGLLVIICAYKIYENGEEQAYVQEHSSVVKMPIVRREKGWGTVRSPNKIYVRHRGKTYSLPASNRYFRQTARADSILVNYDAERDMAVLSIGKVSGPYPLLIAVFLCGLLLVGNGLYDFFVDYRARNH